MKETVEREVVVPVNITYGCPVMLSMDKCNNGYKCLSCPLIGSRLDWGVQCK